MDTLRFTEVEHKFVVDAAFDLARFRRTLDALTPLRHQTLRVRDRYFITESGRDQRFVIRHRFDQELHELTIKALVPDAEVRDEISLNLQAGDQEAQVDAFVGRLGVVWQGSLWKDLEVWYFADCEVVHYTATSGDRTVRCVEFEATQKPSIEAALAIVGRYEALTGFDPASRTRVSLLGLLWPGAMSGPADYT